MSTLASTGHVYLVGAGPGPSDLITLRGWRLLMVCDALVYDHLVDAELIEACQAPIKVYVGKVAGRHAMPQAEINALLVSLAKRESGPRCIVRLKGGDPFVFGRGGEEALACANADVPFEVVPGVTAGTAAAAAAGVPVTHRDLSRGVVFVTGHMSGDGELDLPWDAFAHCGLTLVFFMAVSTADRIGRALIDAGMRSSTPAMIVQEGTTDRQRSLLTTVSDLGESVRRAGIEAPAILVIGKVASLAETLSHAESARRGDVRRSDVWSNSADQSVDRYSIASCSHPHA
ncbi:MAG: uroporphyrinogen-III C-methyltransferase [Deltaproteobacteria bacterium]|nr:uroporphyrinogen-III C-methyltransferase [Deltaproteobacteria bacterium]